MFRSAAQQAGLGFTVDFPPLAEVHLDRQAWERILSNLLSNAIKFTHAGSVGVRLRRRKRCLVMEVHDTGIGIRPDELGKVFDRFYRGSDPRARTHEGAGIGLALVRELVQLHGGTVEAQSHPGSGTRMIVRIPCGERSGPPAASAPLPASDPSAAFLAEEARGWASGLEVEPPRQVIRREHTVSDHGKPDDRVLIVEDNRDMRDYLRRLLASQFRVDIALDGGQAFEIATNGPPGAIVTDVMMPGQDGLALVDALRRDVRTRDVPVVVISARADPASRMEAINRGADDYLVKPFRAHELLGRLQATLAASRLRAHDAEARGRERERALREDELRALLADLKKSQGRVAAAADAERRRIESNLHDGAQQRLMAIRLELGLLEELVEQDPTGARAEIGRLHTELNVALEELRELAHGLYPPLLASDGLHAAISGVALRAALPVVVEGDAVGRLPRAIESAAYFACLEALQNAAKHAGQGARATVELTVRPGMLTFSIADDGHGFDIHAPSRGQGLTNLRDRIGAVGGDAEVRSAPGRGTTVIGRIPLP